MSATAVKAERRKIRRVLNDDVIAFVGNLREQQNALADAQRDTSVALAGLQRKTDAYLTRGFFGRVKWLVVGR